MTLEEPPSFKGSEGSRTLLALLARRVLYPEEEDDSCAPRMSLAKEMHVKEAISRLVGSIAAGEEEAEGRPSCLDVPVVKDAERRENVERGILARCLELHREGRSGAADALEESVEAFRYAVHSRHATPSPHRSRPLPRTGAIPGPHVRDPDPVPPVSTTAGSARATPSYALPRRPQCGSPHLLSPSAPSRSSCTLRTLPLTSRWTGAMVVWKRRPPGRGGR